MSIKKVVQDLLQTPNVNVRVLQDDGTFPNNPKLPLLVYQGALSVREGDPRIFEEIFHSNGWGGSWRNGIYTFHHYHSTAHEVLGIYRGEATVQLGGPTGPEFRVRRGDVIIIPAGVSHKNLGCTDEFRCVGAYPLGQSWDMNYGKPGERPRADENIQKVPLPRTDPVFGDGGPLHQHWLAA